MLFLLFFIALSLVSAVQACSGGIAGSNYLLNIKSKLDYKDEYGDCSSSESQQLWKLAAEQFKNLILRYAVMNGCSKCEAYADDNNLQLIGIAKTADGKAEVQTLLKDTVGLLGLIIGDSKTIPVSIGRDFTSYSFARLISGTPDVCNGTSSGGAATTCRIVSPTQPAGCTSKDTCCTLDVLEEYGNIFEQIREAIQKAVSDGLSTEDIAALQKALETLSVDLSEDGKLYYSVEVTDKVAELVPKVSGSACSSESVTEEVKDLCGLRE